MDEFTDTGACADAIIERVGKRLHVAAPLAVGKPNRLLNALYARAKADPEIELTLYTALTLERPKGASELETRFLGPFVERVFGDYPDLDYELDRTGDGLPDNVRVLEFYFPAGKYTGNAQAQRDYISSNYTHVARDLLDRDINVLVQQVARGEVDGKPMLSLSCNADVSPDLMTALQARERGGATVAFAAQINSQLPFMYGQALVKPGDFHFVIDSEDGHYQPFGPPRMSVSDADYMIGLYASSLVKDGGELQVGIGALSDAIVHALCMRQQDNASYQRVLQTLDVEKRFGAVIERKGETGTFEQGLFAATEMMVDGFMHLVERGIIKRRVYDDLPIQRLLNEGAITEEVTPHTLTALLEARALHSTLTERDVVYLRYYGVLHHDVGWQDGKLVAPGGERLDPNLTNPESLKKITDSCLGEQLKHGAIIHGGFFIGPQDFYRWLREMPETQRQRIHMKSISAINQLYGHEALDRLHRRHGRFVNTGMMVTMSGAVVSDGLEDGTVISGVGGQYNFVAMAQALPDGYSILQIRSTRMRHGELVSNVVWNYGHITIPRHLRDIVITEYGIADLRGKTDEEVIKALLCVTDSHFQDELLEKAKKSGKLADDYEIPAEHSNNTAEVYEEKLATLKTDGLFPAFPFGTELTDEEVVLGRALKVLKRKIESTTGALEALADGVVDGAIHGDVRPYLERMGLHEPSTLKETVYQRLLAAELRNEGIGKD